MDYLSRNSVVLDRIFHGFFPFIFPEIIHHSHASVHAYKCTHTHREVLLHCSGDTVRHDLAAV